MSRLNDAARQQLAAIVTLEGPKVAEDERLCEAFLRDYCTDSRLEIAALVAAVRWGVPRSLKEAPLVPPATLRANLSRRLQENHGLEEYAAYWAVDSWALVLRPGSWPTGEFETIVEPVVTPRPPKPAPAPPPLPISTPALAPVHPAAAPSADYTAAAQAFVNGEKAPELDSLLKYVNAQLKKKSQASLIEELRTGGVPTGTARDLVVKVRRRHAAKKLGFGGGALILGFFVAVSAVSGGTANGGLSALGLLLITVGSIYSLYSAFLLIRLS